MPLVKLIGYAPDLDATTPGVITNCVSLVPSTKGMVGARSPVNTAHSAMAAACKGAVSLRKLDDSIRTFGGTATALYELGASSWSDVTRASGGAYALSADSRWRFAQFGDVSLAVAKSDIIQYSNGSGAFANVGGTAPKAAIVETVGQFVFLFNVNDQGSLGSFGDSPDRWWNGAVGSYTDWTPAIATQCSSGRLTATPGPIKAGKRFGKAVVAYKERSMYLGTYGGPPVPWDFSQIQGEAGALCQEAVVDIGTPEVPMHIFMGADDFWLYDGSRAARIGTPVKSTVFSELNNTYRSAVIGMHDAEENLVRFWYPSASSYLPDKCVVYNYRTDRWGRDDRQVEFAFAYSPPALQYDDVGTLYATYADFPASSYDTAFFSSGGFSPAIINTSHRLQTLSGAHAAGSWTTGDMGDDNLYVLLSRFKPRYVQKPDSAQMTNFYKQNLGDSLTTAETVAMMDSRFDVLRSARWHRVLVEEAGDRELTGFDVQIEEGSDE